MKHFLNLKDIPAADLRAMLARAVKLKADRKQGKFEPLLAHKKLAMIFEKNSTRTRVSFEAGMYELGGHALYLSSNDLQLGRGETVADTARVLSRYVDAIMLRANFHTSLVELAKYATVPVVNGLTDFNHPCQLMADVMTVEERLGSIQGKKIAWVGDGNNVANSWIEASRQFDFQLHLACPKELPPDARLLEWAGKHATLTADPVEAASGAHVVVTDTWISMGDTASQRELLLPYQVDEKLMKQAGPDAIFLHCLPAHRGEEVADAVIDGRQSAVWDEAENRLHAQKAILLWALGK